MKFCRECGKELKENADVCLNCGVMTKINPERDKLESRATVGLILGLIGIVAWFIPLFGYPVTITGIVFSTRGLNAKEGRKKAVAGLTLNIIFLIVTLINSILGVMMAMDLLY